MSHRWSTLLAFLLIASFLIPPLFAQEPSRKNSSSARQSSNPETFADQFWMYLLSNNYKHWSPGPGSSGEHFESEYSFIGQSPHGALLKTYMNRIAVANSKTLPVGSVIILENYRVDKSLDSISVMYQSPGFNPKANDWYWIHYNPDGSVSKSQAGDKNQGAVVVASFDGDGVQQTFTSAKLTSGKLMGRASSCIQCHSQSSGSDFAFFNDADGR